MKLIELNLQQIFALCRLHKVKQLFVFGSILTPRFNSQSDIDMIVGFEDMPLDQYADNYFKLKEALSRLFNREVDLLEDSGIKNIVLKANIDRTKKLIYG